MSPRAVPLRLSVMFLLQYMVFGAQSMLLGGHMGALGFVLLYREEGRPRGESF